MGITGGFVYAGGVLAPIPVPVASQGTPAWGINDAGVVVGSVYREGGLGNTVFTYAGGVLTERPAPRALATAYDISNSGYVIATYSKEFPAGTHTPRAVVWSPQGRMTELGVPGGNTSMIGAAVNEQGHITGTLAIYGTPFIYRDGQIINLGKPPGAGYLAEAKDINESDQVVGTYNTPFESPYHGFLYSNGKYTDLTSAVTLPGGFSITGASAINDVGQIVVHATNVRNETRTFLLTPVPEPVSGGVVVVVVGAMMLARRRRRTIAPWSRSTACPVRRPTPPDKPGPHAIPSHRTGTP
jgi:probable HAF family extracellular repeat protein